MPFPDYTSLPQYANILHIWKLDEESGTRVDSKGDCDLSDNNTVLYGSGKIGNGADFEASLSEYLSATAEASADMNFTSGNFSISFWVRPESIGSTQNFLNRYLYGVTDAGYLIYTDWSYADINVRVYQDGATQSVYSDSYVISAGTLAHITIVRNGVKIYIYIDSVDKTSYQPDITDPDSANAPLYIGRDIDGYYCDGLLDEIIVWNVALSPAEVSTLYSWYSKVGLSGAISFSGDLSRKLSLKRLLEGDVSFEGTLVRQKTIRKLLEGSLSFIGTLQRKLSLKRTLEGKISFIGTLGFRTLWTKLTRAVASMTKLIRGSSTMTKDAREESTWEKEER